MSRTNPEHQRALYQRITVQAAAEALGISAEHVLALGEAGELDVVDLRRPGAQRGVYRVAPASVDAMLERRRLGRVA